MKIIVTNSGVQLVDLNKIQEANGISFRVSAYGSLKMKEKTKLQFLRSISGMYKYRVCIGVQTEVCEGDH